MNLTLMPYVVPTCANEVIGEEIGDYCHVLQCLCLVCSFSGNTTTGGDAVLNEHD